MAGGLSAMFGKNDQQKQQDIATAVGQKVRGDKLNFEDDDDEWREIQMAKEASIRQAKREEEIRVQRALAEQKQRLQGQPEVSNRCNYGDVDLDFDDRQGYEPADKLGGEEAKIQEPPGFSALDDLGVPDRQPATPFDEPKQQYGGLDGFDFDSGQPANNNGV